MPLHVQVPFQAKSMSELKSKVIAGSYKGFGSSCTYSPALKNLCTSMLQIDVSQRATVSEILSTPEVQQRLMNVPGAEQAESVAPVLGTIVVPKNLKQLPYNLPGAAYDEIRATRY